MMRNRMWDGEIMDDSTVQPLNYLLYVSLLIGAAILYFGNSPQATIPMLLYMVYSALLIYHAKQYCLNEKRQKIGQLLLGVILVIAAGIHIFDHSKLTGFYLILLVTYALLVYQYRFSVPFSILAVIIYMTVLYNKSPASSWMDFWYENNVILIPRLMIICIFMTTIYISKMNSKNKQLADSLQSKTLELEKALNQVTVYAEELKETADLRAREKIMHDLHDKLGHVLATASIGAQAAIVLIDQDRISAKKRLEIVAENIQSAMQSVRDLISGGNTYRNEGEQGFAQSMISLLSETVRRTGISINHNLTEESGEVLNELPLPVRSFLYNALMEGLTNGIKHGAATEFEFGLTCTDNRVEFKLKDKGRGFNNLTFGFGLAKMQRDIKRLGGHFEISSQNGCLLNITIPI